MRHVTFRMLAVGSVLFVGLTLGACSEESPTGDDEFQLDGSTQTDGGPDVTEIQDTENGDPNERDSGTADTLPPDDVSTIPEDTGTPVPEDTNIGDDEDTGTGPLGACCAEGECGTTTESGCQEADGTWNEGKTCAEVDCVDQVVCCAEIRGATTCTIVESSQCTDDLDGTAKSNASSCRDVTCDGQSDLWACCGAGICGNVTKSTCDQFGAQATYYDGQTCSEIDC